MKKTIVIEGMSCNHCVMAVKNALGKINGVKNVEVELENKRALVEGDGLIDKDLKEAVENAGYDVLEID